MSDSSTNFPAQPRSIDSKSNPALKGIRAALRRGELAEECWVAESPRLLEEALRSGLAVKSIYVAHGRSAAYRERFGDIPAKAWTVLSDRAIDSLGNLETSQGLFALVEKPHWEQSAFFSAQRFLVVLDQVQDPGNAGTILRAAEAFGATGAVFLSGSASPDSPKVLRASAGSLFRLPCLKDISVRTLLEGASSAGITLYAGLPKAEAVLPDLEWRWPAALVIGNEGAGVCDELLRAAVGFRIPTQHVESLNAAVSSSIALYAMSLSRRERRT